MVEVTQSLITEVNRPDGVSSHGVVQTATHRHIHSCHFGIQSLHIVECVLTNIESLSCLVTRFLVTKVLFACCISKLPVQFFVHNSKFPVQVVSLLFDVLKTCLIVVGGPLEHVPGLLREFQ